MGHGHRLSPFPTPLVAVVLALPCVGAMSGSAGAVPGTLVASVTLPVQGYGVSIAADCNYPVPNLYYTLENDPTLYITNKFGADLGSKPILSPAGAPVVIDEMAFDRFGSILYGCEHSSDPVNIWVINPATGAAQLAFRSEMVPVGTFRDGLAYDASDNTLWVSGDVRYPSQPTYAWYFQRTIIEHYTVGGAFINQITPLNSSGDNLNDISGVQVGVGDQLYVGTNGSGQIVRVRKSDGGFIGAFASPGGSDEGLECDPNSFPQLVLWSRDFDLPAHVDAIELEPGTCACGGATPTHQPTWGAIKVRYR
jgi:hypothetical protein